ncbi:MAG: cellulase family glycosylhydrolase [Thermoleophilia bacterium]
MTSEPRTLRRIATGAAVAVSVGAALALPASGVGAVAAIQDDVLTAGPAENIPQRLDLVKATKAKVARFDILWSLVAKTRPANPTDPNDPAYDWSRADQVLEGFAAAGIKPIVSVYSTPDWAVSGTPRDYESEYNPNAPVPADFADFYTAAATRYNGFFVRPDDGVTLPRVRLWEVWNEPNLAGFLQKGGRNSLSVYKSLLKAAYPAIKAGNRNSIVIGGVGGPRSSTDSKGTGAKTWLTGLVGDKSVKFDAYSQHIYPSQGPKYYTKSYARAFPSWLSLDYIYKQLDRKKKGMKLFVTEAGYTTAKTDFRKVKVSFAQQNLYLKQLFALPAVKSPRLAAIVWFNLQDNLHTFPDGSITGWPGGLLKVDGSKKPAYASFVAIARKPIPAALRATFK